MIELTGQTIEILTWAITGLALAFTLYALNDFLLSLIQMVMDALR